MVSLVTLPPSLISLGLISWYLGKKGVINLINFVTSFALMVLPRPHPTLLLQQVLMEMGMMGSASLVKRAHARTPSLSSALMFRQFIGC